MESHQKWKKIAKTLFILIGITVLLECTLFNYRYWESKNYKPTEDIFEENAYAAGADQDTKL